VGLTNGEIAELLALEAEGCKEVFKGKALRKASRTAFLWPIEAADLLQQNRSLTELPSVGPYISRLIQNWIEKPPVIPEPPGNRKDFLTITEARKILAGNPKWKAAYRGDLQMHTTWSDGSGSVLDMAKAGKERGYSYIAITDHSKGLKIAGGINEREVAEQAEEIDAVNDSLEGFTVLKSIELNLTPSGAADLEEETLRKMDIVVGSFHSALRRMDDQTERYLAALDNECVHILGHPRGRVYNYRLGLTADWGKVFDRAAEVGKAIEIDSYPDRQDLNHELLLLAKKAGCMISIDTDAHHPHQLDFIDLGLAAALRAGINPKKIINFDDAKSLRARFQTR
jgi:histidinol phosphatase-like PHP family hydrolase